MLLEDAKDPVPVGKLAASVALPITTSASSTISF